MPCFRVLVFAAFACCFPSILSAADPQWLPPKAQRPVAVVTNEAHLRADQFLKVTLTNGAPPLTAQAVDAFVTARALYREGYFDHCHTLLTAFWSAHPRSLPDWNNQREDRIGYKLGYPSVYPGLILLTDAVAGRMAEKRLKEPVVPFDWNITCMLVGKARGFMPSNDAEAKEGKGRPVSGTIDPTLLANTHAHVQEMVWLTREYYRAVTGGKINLRLEVVHLPEVEFTVCASGGPGPAGGRGAEWIKARDALPADVRRRTDWYWLIFPEIEPGPGDQYHLLSYEKGGTIPGGISRMPGTINPIFICEDHWLTRRPAVGGRRGTNDPVALEIYFPYWLQHEFNHDHFGRNPHLQLELTSHAWFKRDTWPKDFVGRYEPDYYHEAMFKRLQTQAKPSLAGYFIHRTDFPELLSAIKPSDLVGRYSQDKVENKWHAGEIRAVAGQTSQFEWKNDAGVTWGLTLKPGGVLETDARNPYRKGQPAFQIELARGADGLPSSGVGGFRFGNGVFRRQDEAGK